MPLLEELLPREELSAPLLDAGRLVAPAEDPCAPDVVDPPELEPPPTEEEPPCDVATPLVAVALED